MSDGHFYRFLLKLQNTKGDLYLTLEKEIQKNNERKLAKTHSMNSLKAKSFFSLVSNMVNKMKESGRVKHLESKESQFKRNKVQ
jgi:hypothetical protein